MTWSKILDLELEDIEREFGLTKVDDDHLMRIDQNSVYLIMGSSQQAERTSEKCFLNSSDDRSSQF